MRIAICMLVALAACLRAVGFRAWLADICITTGFHLEPARPERDEDEDEDDDSDDDAWAQFLRDHEPFDSPDRGLSPDRDDEDAQADRAWAKFLRDQGIGSRRRPGRARP